MKSHAHILVFSFSSLHNYALLIPFLTVPFLFIFQIGPLEQKEAQNRVESNASKASCIMHCDCSDLWLADYTLELFSKFLESSYGSAGTFLRFVILKRMFLVGISYVLYLRSYFDWRSFSTGKIINTFESWKKYWKKPVLSSMYVCFKRNSWDPMILRQVFSFVVGCGEIFDNFVKSHCFY